jgi:hypothetical protein
MFDANAFVAILKIARDVSLEVPVDGNNSTQTTTTPLAYSSTKSRIDTGKFPGWFKMPTGRVEVMS